MARPKITLDDFPEDWVAQTLALYQNGGSDIEVRAEVLGGICHETWERLLAEEELFSETIKKGRVLAEAWWMRAGRDSLYLDKFQTGPYCLHMKNRFGWFDKTKSETEHSGSMSISWPLGKTPLDA
jgi:hypothetical protein